MSETVRFEDLFDSDVIKGFENLKKESQQLVDKLKELTKISLENNKASKEVSKSTKTINEAQKQLNKEYKAAEAEKKKLLQAQNKLSVEYQKSVKLRQDAIKTTKLLATAENQEAGTLERLTARNSLLRRERSKLNLETEKGRIRLQKINAEIDKNTKKIRENSDAADKQRMNIGNYGSALSGLSPALASATMGIQRMTAALKLLLMTPIGLLVAGVMSLVGAFKLLASTDTGGTRIEAEWEGVKSALDEARRSALDGDWKKAFSILTGGFSRAQKAAIEYTFELDRINDRINFQRAQMAQMELEIAQNENKAKDRGLSAQARYDAAAKALDLRNEKLKLEKKNTDELYFAELRRISKSTGISTKLLSEFITGTDAVRERILVENQRFANFRENSEDELFKLAEVGEKKLAAETSFQKETKRLTSELSSLKIQLAKETADEEIEQIKRVRDYENSEYNLRIEMASTSYEKLRLEEEKFNNDIESRIEEQNKKYEEHIRERQGGMALDSFLLEHDRVMNEIALESLQFNKKIEQARKELDNQAKEKRIKERNDLISQLEQQKQYDISMLKLRGVSEKTLFDFEQNADKRILEVKRDFELLNEQQYQTHLNNLELARRDFYEKWASDTQKLFDEINKEFEIGGEEIQESLPEIIKWWEKFLPSEEFKNALKTAASEVLSILQENADKEVELSRRRTDRATQEVEKMQTNLNREIELREQGREYNILAAEKELRDAERIQKEAEKKEQEAVKNQQRLQTIQQTSSLITASANIIQTSGGVPLVYIPLLATMWGTFLQAKIKAQKSTEYADGGTFKVGGGSHASGNDTSLGIHGGSERKVQNGEIVAVINDKAVKRHGERKVEEYINAINNTDMSGVEGGVNKLVMLNSEKYYMIGNKLVKKVGNKTVMYV